MKCYKIYEGFGVQWMCILRNDLHFNEVYYTWEAIAWLSFLNNDFDCVRLSKRAHYTKEVIIQLYRLIWWPPIYAVLLEAIGPAVRGIQNGNYLWEIASWFQLAVQRAFFFKKRTFNSDPILNLKATLQLLTAAKKMRVCPIVQVERKHLTCLRAAVSNFHYLCEYCVCFFTHFSWLVKFLTTFFASLF